MKITITTCAPLTLSEEDIAPESAKFDGKTSYASKLVSRLGQKAYRETKLPFKLECLRLLRNRANELGGYKTYFEPLAGVGLSARLFDPKGRTWLNDLDEGCQNVLKENFPKASILGGDALTMTYPTVDMTFLDFNDFTFKRYLQGAYKDALCHALRCSSRFVVLNDCSPFYFRYGASSFEVYSKLMGCTLSSVEDYFKALRSEYAGAYPEWRMVHCAHFSESSFQLFYKGKAPLVINSVKVGLPVRVNVGGLLS